MDGAWKVYRELFRAYTIGTNHFAAIKMLIRFFVSLFLHTFARGYRDPYCVRAGL